MTRGLPSLPPPVPSYRDRLAPSNKGPSSVVCINVADLGCIADGVFDNGPILQAAIADNASAYLLKLCFPVQNPEGPNFYLTSQALSSFGTFLTLAGVRGSATVDGSGLVSLCRDDPDGDIFSYVTSVNADGMGFLCGFDGGAYTGGVAGTAGAAFTEVASAAGFDHCTFGTGGVAVTGCPGGFAALDCDVFGQSALLLPADSFAVVFDACLFSNCYQALTHTGGVSSINDLRVIGCGFSTQIGLTGGGGGERPWIEADLRTGTGSISYAQNGVLVSGNTFGANCLAIDIDGENGTIYDPSFGTGLSGTALVNVVGNLFHACLPRSGQATIKVKGNYNLIANNVLGPYNASVAGDSIMVHGDHCRVTGNVSKGFRYGVNVLTGSTNTAVEGNTLTGTTGALLDSGTGTTNVNNMA